MKKFVLVAFFAIAANAETVKRIKSIAFDKGKVEKIYIAAGMASVLTFPCSIDEAFSGNESQITIRTSPTTKKQLTVLMSQTASMPTNLFVRCGQKKDPMVFDIVPSRNKHQDYVKIRSSFGGADYEDSGSILVNSSEKPNPEPVIKKKSRYKVIEIEPEKEVTKEESNSAIQKLRNKKTKKIIEVDSESEKRDELKKELKKEVEGKK